MNINSTKRAFTPLSILSVIAACALIQTPVAADPPGGITCKDCADIGPCSSYSTLLNTTHECRVIDGPTNCKEWKREYWSCNDTGKGGGHKFIVEYDEPGSCMEEHCY